MSTEQNNGKPAVPPKRNLLNDRRIRLLLSLLGAVIAWMAVTIVVQPGTMQMTPESFSVSSSGVICMVSVRMVTATSAAPFSGVD